jgi:hypothetical protein
MTAKCPVRAILRKSAPSLAYRCINEVASQVVDQIAHFGEASLPVLSQLLDDDRRGLRQERLRLLLVCVIGELAQRPGNPWIGGLLPRLIEMVRADGTWSMQSGAVRAIGAMEVSAADAIPVLESWYQSSNEWQRIVAAMVLLKVAPDHQRKPEFLHTLVNGICSGNRGLASYAAAHLVNLEQEAEAVLESLERIHASQCRLTQCYSGQAIYGISGNLQPYLDGLVSLLESAVVSNRMLATVKLAVLGPRAISVVERLRQVLAEFPSHDTNDDQKVFRQYVEQALVEIVTDPLSTDSATTEHD